MWSRHATGHDLLIFMTMGIGIGGALSAIIRAILGH